MIRIIEAWDAPLLWEGRWESSVRSGEALIGTIALDQDVAMSALARSADGQWRFKKSWFPLEKVTVRPVDFDNPVAVMKNKRMEKRASLEFPYGQVFYWKAANFWMNQHVFMTRFGEHILRFKRHSSPFTAMAFPKGTSKGTMTVEQSALYISEISLLLLLGCYLSIIDGL